MSKTISAIDYRLRDQFEVLRARLLDAASIPRNKPLAYWALPADRRLPMALLGRSLDELLAMPYAEIAATPGIGHKKLAMLITLIGRVRDSLPASVPLAKGATVPASTSHRSSENGVPATLVIPAPVDPNLRTGGSPTSAPHPHSSSHVHDPAAFAAERLEVNAVADGGSRVQFDAARVSETQWEKWRETVRRHELEQEMLGSVAQSLRSLPTVIWHVPLASYLELSLAQIRALRTHGEKRVRAILRVFWEIETVFGAMPRNPDFAVRLIPRNLVLVESWLSTVLAAAGGSFSAAAGAAISPDGAEIRQNLISPILNQLQNDAGDVVAGLAERRLAIDSPALCVSQESNRMGVTRARIYQLLDGCAKIMAIRWPRGRWMLDDFASRIARSTDPSPHAAVRALQSLCFPVSERSTLELANLDPDAPAVDVTVEREELPDNEITAER